MKRFFVALLITAALIGGVSLLTKPKPFDFSNADRIAAEMARDLIPEAEGQTPPIPTGQQAITGIGSSTTTVFLGAMTGVSPGPGTILLAAPSPATVSNYVYQAQCFSSSGTATVAVLLDSATTGVAPSIQQIGYINCPASAGANPPYFFNPPLKLRAGSALGISSQVAVTTAFFYASGFRGR